MKNKKKTRSPSLYVGMIIAVIVLTYVSVSLAGEIRRRRAIQGQIEELKQIITEEKNKVENIKKLIGYLQTEAYVERAAHEKLGLKKTNENVVFVPQEGAVAAAKINKNKVTSRTKSVPEQWWNLFFASEQQ